MDLCRATSSEWKFELLESEGFMYVLSLNICLLKKFILTFKCSKRKKYPEYTLYQTSPLPTASVLLGK